MAPKGKAPAGVLRACKGGGDPIKMHAHATQQLELCWAPCKKLRLTLLAIAFTTNAQRLRSQQRRCLSSHLREKGTQSCAASLAPRCPHTAHVGDQSLIIDRLYKLQCCVMWLKLHEVLERP